MRKPLLSTLFAAALGTVAVAGSAHAAGKVEVQFVEPDKYIDAGRWTYDRERTLAALGEFMQSLGKELPDGQTLTIEVLDIDLAGTLEPVRSGEIRVMRDRADWPHMKIRYVLQGTPLSAPQTGGTTLKSGTSDIADIGYMQGLRGAGLFDGAYGHEKRMLQQWFRKTLLAP